MKPKSAFGSIEKETSRKTIFFWYAVLVAALFIFLMCTSENKNWATSNIWQFADGFVFGNVLGFCVAIAKYRVNIFYSPNNIIDYVPIFIVVIILMVGAYIAVRLLSGDGRAAAVIGAVVAVVVCIPATFESWLEAKQEIECLRAIRHESKTK